MTHRSFTLVRPGAPITALLLLMLGSASHSGCSRGGEGPPETTPPTRTQGFTECGSVLCQPGQWCNNLACETGCLSNVNCAEAQVCDTDDPDPFGVSQCVNVGGPPPIGDAGPGTTDTLADCRAACDRFQTCGLTAADTAGCRSDCAGLSDDQRRAVAGCASMACSGVLGCLGVDCFTDADCPGGSCVGNACL